MQLSISNFAFVLLFLSFVFIGCEDDLQTIPEPTFENVPEAMDFSNTEGEEVVSGVTKYVVGEGQGPDRVTKLDVISIFITLRTEGGTIIYSSFQNARTEPIDIRVQNIVLETERLRDGYGQTRAYTAGLQNGLVGMRQGEDRVLIVEPEQGFRNIPNGMLNTQYRDSTLRYDITLQRIF